MSKFQVPEYIKKAKAKERNRHRAEKRRILAKQKHDGQRSAKKAEGKRYAVHLRRMGAA